MKIYMQTLSFKDSVSKGEYDLFEIISIAKDLGYDGVDLEDRQFASTEPGYLDRLRKHCDDLGLPIGYVGVIGGFGQGMNGDDEGHMAAIRKWTAVCSHMKIPFIRLIGCAPGEGESDEDAWPRTRERFKIAAEQAGSVGVKVGLHNHNHGMFPATGDQILRMLDEVNSPHFTHILDTGQYRGSKGASKFADDPDRESYDFYKYIGQSLHRAEIVRTKIYKITSGEEEWIDYHKIFAILNDGGFDGPISVVYEGRDGLSSMDAMRNAQKFLSELRSNYGL